MKKKQFGDLLLFPFQQMVCTNAVADVTAVTRQTVQNSGIFRPVQAGDTVCIGIPSRGIACIKTVLLAVIEELRALEARPFIVPAMGSHGGGTAEGQKEVLAGYGMSEMTLGIPVKSDIEALLAGEMMIDGQPFPMYWDQHAAQADHVLVINRIKEHTAFTGPVESGLMKIIALGLGKPQGARALHQTDLSRTIPMAAQWLIDRFPILGGIAILENGRHEAMQIEAVPASTLAVREPQLLEHARAVLPRIPFKTLDVLILGTIGKDISGTGMDTNVIGKYRRNWGEPVPNYRRIVALNLTDASHGNATGVGFADIITQQLYEKIDLPATRLNCLTAGNFNGAKIPIIARDEIQAVDWAMQGIEHSIAQVVYAESTLDLETLWVSDALLEACERHGLKSLA